MSDRLHDTLSTLRTDVDSMPLADSSAVRARGAQRTRRQAVGTSLAVVALVAGAIGISGALTGTNKASDLPADRTTTTTAPTVETLTEVGPEALLTVAELPALPPYEFSIGQTVDPAIPADASAGLNEACGGPVSPGGLPDSAVLRIYATDLDASMWHWVARYPTADKADEVYADLMAGCTDKGSTVTELKSVGSQPDSPGAFRASKFSADPGSEYFGEVTGVVRVDNTIAVIGLRAMVKESDVDMDAFDASVVTAAERLSTP
jgi:hypothetical protein